MLPGDRGRGYLHYTSGHYELKVGVRMLTLSKVACVPHGTVYNIFGAELGHPGFQLTGEPACVTCPLCQVSPSFPKGK